ncbi:MAG: FHA domain-containing protein [Bryobacteraceae bacterium]
MDELTRAGRPSPLVQKLGFGSDKQAEYKILDPDWTIDFHSDAEEKLQRGEIEIYSELASAKKPEFDGAMTRHVTKRVTEATTKVVDPGKAYAQIRYQGNTIPVTKDTFVIGRGGKSFWVDLKLEAPPDVSREHCRIRRDPATGHFYIQDVSQYGTSIDGKPIAEKNVDVPLPGKCTVTLADVVRLEFEGA